MSIIYATLSFCAIFIISILTSFDICHLMSSYVILWNLMSFYEMIMPFDVNLYNSISLYVIFCHFYIYVSFTFMSFYVIICHLLFLSFLLVFCHACIYINSLNCLHEKFSILQIYSGNALEIWICGCRCILESSGSQNSGCT